jgi:flagella basal body P-ring formation protein FlgA
MDKVPLRSIFPVVILFIILIFAFNEAEAGVRKLKLSGIPVEQQRKTRLQEIKKAEEVLNRIQNPVQEEIKKTAKKSQENTKISKREFDISLKSAHFINDEKSDLKRISLSDLIDWSKSSEEEFSKRKIFKNVILGILKPGDYRVHLSKGDLERILANSEVSNLKVHIPNGVTVIRPKLVLSERIKTQINEELAEVYGTSMDNLNVDLKRLHIHVPLKRIGELGSELDINSPHIKRGRLSNLLFKVHVRDSSGKIVEHSYVSVKAEVQANIAVSRRKLGSREALNFDSVAFKWKAIPAIGKPLFKETSIEELRIKRDFASGKILLKSDVEISPLGEVGDQVSIYLNSNGLKVRSIGKLLEKAYLGKKVRVKNISTQRILEGRVIKPDLIEVVL